MANVAQKQKFGQAKHPWFYVERLIAGLNAPPTIKYLLSLIHLHTNARRRFAWASQELIAYEMCRDVKTVERLFAWVKKRKLVIVRNVRTGPKDQHNEFYLNIEHMEDWQREPWQRESDTDDPSPMSGQKSDDDPAQVRGHAAPMTPQMTPDDPAFSAGRPRTHVGRGNKIEQVATPNAK
jgi:hypothetical protein